MMNVVCDMTAASGPHMCSIAVGRNEPGDCARAVDLRADYL